MSFNLFEDTFDFSRIPDYILHDAVHEFLNGWGIEYSQNKYNFRCRLCGDSKDNPNKKRGFILTNPDAWVYFCHNCGTNTSFTSVLKDEDPALHGRVISHAFSSNNRNSNGSDDSYEEEYFEIVPISKLFKEGELLSILDNHPTCIVAKAQCMSRKIPYEVYSKWYVCIEGDEFTSIVNGSKVGNEYKNRIIIPYYNFSGYWYQFDARDITGKSKMRYKNRSDVPREFYKIDLLDTNKPFFLTEGAIDACFISNSVSFGGTAGFKKLIREYPSIINNAHNCTVIWDNDSAGYDKLPESINLGLRWFNWSEISVRDDVKYDNRGNIRAIKDINDLVLYTNAVNTDEKGYINVDSLLKYSESPDGGIIKVNMLYGNRKKMMYKKRQEMKKHTLSNNTVFNWG
jgi:hypothetical protein